LSQCWRERVGANDEADCWAALRQLVGLHSALRTKSFFMQRGKNVLQEIGWRDDEFDWQWTLLLRARPRRAQR
jgi:hypothetical protein